MIDVLYIDDEPFLLDIAKIFLERLGYIHVDTVSSGQEALEYLKNTHCDCIISDYEMPLMDGIELLKEIRHREIDIPFIIFTGKGREEIVINALNSGADFYIQKVGDPDSQFAELSHNIHKAVAQKRSERALMVSEQEKTIILNSFSQYIIYLDSKLVIQWTNQVTAEELSINGKPLPGNYCYEILKQRDSPCSDCPVSRMFQDGEPVCTETTTPDGKYWKINATPIRNSENTIIGAVETIQDITTEKNAEELIMAQRDHGLILASCSSPDEIMRACVDIAIKISGRESGGLYLLNRETESFSLKYSTGLSRQFIEEANTFEKGTEFWNLATEGLLFTSDHFNNSSLKNSIEHEGISSAIFLPVYNNGEINGCISTVSYNADKPCSANYSALKMIAARIGNTISRMQADNQLRESEEHYRTLFEGANDAIFIIENEQLLEFNQKALVIFRCSKDQMQSYTPWDFIPTSQSGGISSRQKAMKLMHAALEEGPQFFECKCNRSDGTIFDAELSLNRVEYSGRVILQVIVRDLSALRMPTAKKMMDEPVAEDRELLDLITDSGHIGIWNIDLNGGSVAINNHLAKMLGYSPEEMDVDTWKQIIHPDDLYRVAESRHLYEAGDEPCYRSEHRLRKTDGRWLWVQETGKVTRWDDDGHPLRIIGTLQDITDLRQSGEAVKEVNNKLNYLTGIIRHDILNQVAIVSGYTELLAEDLPDDPATNEFVRHLVDAAKTIQSQITFTRDYGDMGVKSPCWQNVEEAVRRSAAIVTMGDDVRLSVDTGSLEIFAVSMLEKVFSNLFDNSLRYGGHVTEISVSSYVDDDTCIILVEDNGTGIPPENKLLIFEPGYGSNTGYRLFLTHEILSVTKIDIKEDGEYGTGTRFVMTVPREAYRGIKS